MCNGNCKQGRNCACAAGHSPLTQPERIALVLIFLASAAAMVVAGCCIVERIAS